MAAAPQARPDHVSPLLDLADLATRLSEVPSTAADGTVHGPDVLGASLVMQAGELRSAHRHGVGEDQIASQMAGLLCGVVQFGNFCGIDIVTATEEHLSARELAATPPRPQLREVG